MRTHQYAQKEEASSSSRTSVPRLYEVQPSGQPPPIQEKSNEEGLAEHAERVKKFQRLGNSMIQMGPPRLDNDQTSSLQPKPWIQRKLTIGQPGDKYGQEADRVASQVIHQINAPNSKENNLRRSIQREKDLQWEKQAKCFRAAIQRRQVMTNEEASADLESAINSARGSGKPLDAGLQQSMGQAMGADFSEVRVHTDTQSDQLNQSIQSKAFTTGQDVFFREGAYQPGNRGGQELIAHELTHVVQQSGLSVRLNDEPRDSLTQSSSIENTHANEVAIKCNPILACRSAQKKTRDIQPIHIHQKVKDLKTLENLSIGNMYYSNNSLKSTYPKEGVVGRQTFMSSRSVQCKPSDFRDKFGKNPQLNLPILKLFQYPGWNAYLINAVRPYFKLDDKDTDKQYSLFYQIYSNERSLRGDAVKESRKEKSEQDSFRLFSNKQLELAKEIGKQYEIEKNEIFGASIGKLDFDKNDVKVKVKDKEIEHKKSEEFIGHEDPSGFSNQLFSDEPSMSDVQQGKLGDCYLLAAVTSIVQRNPTHFVEHMRDNVDGTVTVKFYSEPSSPYLVTVDKSSMGNKYARNFLWVKILEKAYVASGLTNRQKVKKKYADIEGGDAGMALLHLTGKSVTSKTLGTQRSKLQNIAPQKMMESVKSIKEEMRVLNDKIKKIESQKENNLKQNNKGNFSDLDTEIKSLELEIIKLTSQWLELTESTNELQTMLSQIYVSSETLKDYCEKHNSNVLLKKVVEESGLIKNNVLPGELGTGVYGLDEEKAFIIIKNGIDAKKPMTVSTKPVIKDPKNPEEGKGLAGESMVGGLASKHAYSLLDYKPYKDSLKDYKSGEQIYIQLRNPWGNYGRKYKKINGKLKGVADKGGDGTFWIDLADLVAYFERIDVGSVNNL